MRVLIASDSLTQSGQLIHDRQDLESVEIIANTQDEAEVTEVVHRLEPDVLILDMQGPGEDSVRVLQNIHRNGSYPIVIILTDDTRLQYRKFCVEAGAHFLFTKSTELHKIQEVLTRLTHGNNILKDCRCLFEFWGNPEVSAG